MSLTTQGDRGGELIPLPNAPVERNAEDAGAVEATAPALDGELITEAEYQHSRVRRLAESAVSRLLTQWQTPSPPARPGLNW